MIAMTLRTIDSLILFNHVKRKRKIFLTGFLPTLSFHQKGAHAKKERKKIIMHFFIIAGI